MMMLIFINWSGLLFCNKAYGGKLRYSYLLSQKCKLNIISWRMELLFVDVKATGDLTIFQE